jgi:hypothetical protein
VGADPRSAACALEYLTGQALQRLREPQLLPA